MKAMQIGKEKVYHKAVNVGFYGSLFHQGTSAICTSDLQGLIGFTSYHDLFLCCVMRSVAALVIELVLSFNYLYYNAIVIYFQVGIVYKYITLSYAFYCAYCITLSLYLLT